MGHDALINNQVHWYDTHGALIDCHEGCVVRVDGVFWWYGRRYHGNPAGIYGPEGAGFGCGIVCYRSSDLIHWTRVSDCLPWPGRGPDRVPQDWLASGTWHRPRVLFNPRTRRFVMWFFCLGRTNGEWWARDVVAEASTPAGPFTVLGEGTMPGFVPSGDLALWAGADGRGWIANGDWTRNAYVVPLSDDFRAAGTAAHLALSADPTSGRTYEGLCLAEYRGKWLLAASAVVGLAASDTTLAVADAPEGPWRLHGVISRERTWNSQISSFFHLPESDCLIALCDRWLAGPDGSPVPAGHSAQLWVPVTFDPASGSAMMHPLDAWNPWNWSG